MARRGKVNWILLIVVLVGLTTLTATFVGLRTWNRTHRARVGIRRGTEAYLRQDWSNAAAYLGEYLTVNPQDVETLLRYAEAQLNIRPVKRSQIEQAVRTYNQILRIEDNPKAAALLTEIYFHSGELAEAVSRARDFLGRRYDSKVALLLAEVYLKQGKPAEAARLAQTVIEKDPDCIESYRMMGRLTQQDPSLSDRSPQEWFDAAVAVRPEHPRPYLYRAAWAQAAGQSQPAGEDLLRAESLRFDENEDRLRMATLLLVQKEPDRAVRFLRQAREAEPQSLMVWQVWSQWAMETADPNTMVLAAREGLESLRPNHFDFLSPAAELFIRAGAYADAEECIAQLRRMQPDASSIPLLEGMLAQSRRQWPLAVKAWRKMAASAQKSESVLSRLAYALEMMGDPVAAIQEYRNLLTAYPNSGEGHYQLARLLSEQGRYPEALEYARRAVRLLPEDAAALSLLSRLRMIGSGRSPDDRQWMEWNREVGAIADEQQRRQMQIFLIQRKISNGLFDEAAGDLSRLFDQDGPTLPLRLLEAQLMTAREQIAEARSLLLQLIREYPDSIEAVTSLVSLDMKAGRYDAIVAVLEEALPRFPDPRDQKRLRAWLADARYQMGDTQEAMKGLKQWSAQDTQDLSVYRQLLKYSRKTGPLDELQGWVDRIREIEGENGRQYRFEQAYLLFERGDFQKEYPRIVSLLTENLRSYPEDQSSRVLLAAGHQKMGNLRLAVSTYREALDRDPDNMDLVAAAVSVMYRIEDYRQAEEILSRASRKGISDSRLSQLQLQRLLKEGKFTPAGDILQDMLAQSPENRDVKLSLALIRLYNGEIPAAEGLIEEILQVDPLFLPAIAAQVEIRLRQGRTEEALAICGRTREQIRSPKALTLQALTFAKAGQVEPAVRAIEGLLADFETTPENLILASDLYHYLGKIERAQELADQALAMTPDDVQILRKSAFLYSLTPSERQTARQLLEKAMAASPEDAQLRLLKAGFLLEEASESSIQQALEILNNLLFEYPRLESAWVTLAQWTLKQGQTGRAMDQILQGLAYLPNSKSLLMLKARVESERSLHLALPTLEFLYELDPQDGRVVTQLARARLELNRYEEAIDLLEQSRRQPQVSQREMIDQTLISALYRAGRQEQARALFEEKMQQEDVRSSVLLQWSQTLIEDRQWETLAATLRRSAHRYPELISWVAEACLKMGMQESPEAQTAASDLLGLLQADYPDSEPVTLALARLCHYQNRMDEAMENYRRVLSLNPDQEVALNNLAWILCTEKKDSLRALEMANRGLEINPRSGDLLDTRGEIYYSLGRYEEAAADFQKALQLYNSDAPQKAASSLRLVHALVQLGQTQKALEQIRRTLRSSQATMMLTPEQQQELDLLSKRLTTP